LHLAQPGPSAAVAIEIYEGLTRRKNPSSSMASRLFRSSFRAGAADQPLMEMACIGTVVVALIFREWIS
jgi:hypothetical protein